MYYQYHIHEVLQAFGSSTAQRDLAVRAVQTLKCENSESLTAEKVLGILKSRRGGPEETPVPRTAAASSPGGSVIIIMIIMSRTVRG